MPVTAIGLISWPRLSQALSPTTHTPNAAIAASVAQHKTAEVLCRQVDEPTMFSGEAAAGGGGHDQSTDEGLPTPEHSIDHDPFLVGGILVDPSTVALVPTLVDDNNLDRANGRIASVEIVTNDFAGGPVGAALFSFAPWIPFLIDGATYLGSLLPFSRLPRAAPQLPIGPVDRAPSVRAEAIQGFRPGRHWGVLRSPHRSSTGGTRRTTPEPVERRCAPGYRPRRHRNRTLAAGAGRTLQSSRPVMMNSARRWRAAVSASSSSEVPSSPRGSMLTWSESTPRLTR